MQPWCLGFSPDAVGLSSSHILYRNGFKWLPSGLSLAILRVI